MLESARSPVRLLRSLFLLATLTAGLVVPGSAFAQNPDQIGQWGPVLDWGVQAKHMILLPTGEVLVWSTGEDARVWDPSTDDSFTPTPFASGDLHCASQATLADGRVIIGGGQGNETHQGIPVTALFDPFTKTWTSGADMVKSRWYATLLVLDDGRVVITTGDDENKDRVEEPEIYDPISDTWTLLSGASRDDTLYTFMYQLPDGEIFQAGPKDRTWFLDISGNGSWSEGPRNSYGAAGYSVSSAMYRPGEILNAGGGDPAVDTVTVIDMNAGSPSWRDIAPMNFERRRHDLTILPDGTVIAVGGTGRSDDDDFAVMEAEIFDPDTETWTVMDAMDEARMYHSSTVLLPDGRVVAGGGEGGDRRKHAQVFSPPYLFKGARPTITSAPESIGYGGTFSVGSPDAADIASIALIRGAGATHTYDQSQRFIPASFTVSGQTLTVDAPPDAFTAAPGYYMLFLVNSAGVPAIAPFIRVAAGADLIPGTIVGRVRDSGGSPLVGVSVDYPGDSTTTDASGDYSFSNVSAGTHTVTASAPSYATTMQAVAVSGGQQTVANFTLLSSGMVSGHVEAEETGLPIAGANVAYPGGSVVTDSNGDYFITDIPEGLQTLKATAVTFEGHEDTVTVVAGGTVTLDFHLHPGHTVIEGEVLTADGLLPIAGATVSYSGGSATTDFSGFYLLNDVPEGTHTVTASAPGYISQSDPAIVITGFETTLDFALVLEGPPQDVYFPDHDSKVKSSRPSSNYGDDVTLRTKLDSGGSTYVSYLQFAVTGLSEPPVSATLRLYVTDGSNDGGTLYSLNETFDEDTVTYSNAPVCGGTPIASAGAVSTGEWVEFDLTAEISASGIYGWCFSSSSSNSVYYSSKEGVNPPELVVVHAGGGGPSPTRITGTVDDVASGLPIAGATVSYSGGSVQTNAAGTYTFNGVAPGTHTVTASAAGYVLGSDSVAVIAEQTSTLDFSLAAVVGGPQDTYFPNHDAKVKSSSANKSYGSSDTLRTRFQTDGTIWVSYVQFDVTGLSSAPASAVLRLYSVDSTDDGGTLYAVTETFDEDTVTYSNAPACGGTPLGAAGEITPGEWIEFDVTSTVGTSGVYGWCLKSNDSNSGYYSSKEGANPPELVVDAGGSGCTLDSECNDGLFCNGAETCSAGICVAGAIIDCNDGVSCTVDSCDELLDTCVNTDICGGCTIDIDCDDGVFCNGGEVCDAGVCAGGTPPTCNDGVSCTADSCDAASDSCSFQPVHSTCDDGVFCNGAELCDVASGCLVGSPETCNDGVSCTLDSCDLAADQCVNATNDSLCDDGFFCDGAEVCDAGLGCLEAPSGPCAGQSCDEAFDVCTSTGPSPVIAEIQSGLGTGVTSIQTAAGLAAADGDLYIATVSTKPNRTVTSLTGLGLNWQEEAVQCGGRSQTALAVWVAQGSPTGPGSVSANLDASALSAVLTVVRYTNVQADAVGNIVTGNSNGVSGACSGGSDEGDWSLTLPIDVEGAAAFVSVANRHKAHTPLGFDVFSDERAGTGGSTAGLIVGDQIFDTTGSAALGGDFKGTVDWAAVTIEILPGAGGVFMAELPPVPVPVENPITEEKRILGKILFWEEQVSSDDTVACGTCHLPFAGGADPRLGLHPGPDSTFGNDDDVFGSPGVALADSNNLPISHPDFGFDPQVTRRAAPVFIGAQYSEELFVDGAAGSQFLDPLTGVVRIASGGALESQAARPPLSVAEMSHQDRDWAAVVAKVEAAVPLALATNLPSDVAARLASSPTYPDLFTDAFGDSSVSPDRIAFALATYQRTLVPDQTPWDAFMAGDTSALTASQQLGWDAFKVSLCATCHTPPLFSDNQFHNIGVRPPAEDTGRQEVTGLTEDRGKFRSPTLRNAALKSSFMHNGRLMTMAEAVDFYLDARGDQFPDNLDPLMPQVDIPVELQVPLLDFLENGLTDPRVENEQFPFDRPTLSGGGS